MQIPYCSRFPSAYSMSRMKEGKLTPMMAQWRNLKAQAGDALLFFRLGDFYELFEEDALKAAPLLGLTLTTRNPRGDQSPLCGVPVSQLEHYLHKALDQGLKMAVAEQMEPPSPGVLVRREIVQWLTPGIRLLQNDDRPHYAAVVSGKMTDWILGAADVSTGHVVIEKGNSLDTLEDCIERLPIEDLRTPPHFLPERLALSTKWMEMCFLLSLEESEKQLLYSFGLAHLEDVPLTTKLEKQVLGTLFSILQQYHPKDALKFLLPHQNSSSVFMTGATRRNLYLFQPLEKNIFEFLDQTLTAPGRRKLKQVLSSPTQDVSEIQNRQKLLAYFRHNPMIRKVFRSQLSHVCDFHRLLRRRRGPFELFQITKSLAAGCEASHALSSHHPVLENYLQGSKKLQPLSQTLQKSMTHEEAGWFQEGVSLELDELRNLKTNANRMLSEFEERLRKELNISNLKVKFHQIFGYVAEVTSLHKNKIPVSARHLQTLANSERFKTDELEKLEEKVLSLDLRLKEAEAALLHTLYDEVEENRSLLLEWTECLATLDCFQALAEVSHHAGWTTPKTVVETSQMGVERGVHPLSVTAFVPLSFSLLKEETQMILLTGPNMAGKSTVLRLAALIALLHQIGSDVPAERATLSIFNRIVCRMGAADDMATGQSTFFVEMREVATMLQGATEKSLLLFDEIGRGTSTYDGMSLAWAITEAVYKLGCFSLIATHYLELSELEQRLPCLKNYHLEIQEIKGKLIFTRNLLPGSASQSYGIYVARLADLPSPILERAEQKLKEYERKRLKALPLFELIKTAQQVAMD